MKDGCPLDKYFPPEEHTRAITYWKECGTVIGWSEPIKLSHPSKNLSEVGGWWIFIKDKDGSETGIHPKMITMCRECPKNCKK